MDGPHTVTSSKTPRSTSPSFAAICRPLQFSSRALKLDGIIVPTTIVPTKAAQITKHAYPQQLASLRGSSPVTDKYINAAVCPVGKSCFFRKASSCFSELYHVSYYASVQRHRTMISVAVVGLLPATRKLPWLQSMARLCSGVDTRFFA
jgi:hypothetical protein